MHAGTAVETAAHRVAAVACVVASVLAGGCDRSGGSGTQTSSVPGASVPSRRGASAPEGSSAGAGSASGAKETPAAPLADALVRWKFVEYEGGPENTIEVVVGTDRRITCEKEDEEGTRGKQEKSGNVSQAALDSFFREMAAARACHAGRTPSTEHVPGGPIAEEVLVLRGGGMGCTMGLCPDIEPGSRCARIHAALNALMLAGCKTGSGL